MKKFISILLLLATVSIVANAQQSFAKQFKGNPDFTCVTISKAALRMLPLKDKMGVNIGSVADKLDKVEIVNATSDETSEILTKTCERWVEDNGFESFIDADEEGKHASIFTKTDSEPKVFLLLGNDGVTAGVIILYGTMTLEDMRGIIH